MLGTRGNLRATVFALRLVYQLALIGGGGCRPVLSGWRPVEPQNKESSCVPVDEAPNTDGRLIVQKKRWHKCSCVALRTTWLTDSETAGLFPLIGLKLSREVIVISLEAGHLSKERITCARELSTESPLWLKSGNGPALCLLVCP